MVLSHSFYLRGFRDGMKLELDEFTYITFNFDAPERNIQPAIDRLLDAVVEDICITSS